jgi:GNAT superfamily N-acetyltransferase
MGALITRRLQPGDLAAALRLTQAQRWSHRMEDWEFHFRLGRGWVVCDADGRMLGTASWWAYGDGFATVGLVLVDQNQQGKGIGRRLMTTVMDDAGARVLQLVATKAGLKLYQQCGFREVGGIGQHQGIPTSGIRGAAELVPPETVLRAVSPSDLAFLCDLDAVAWGANRSEVVGAVLNAGGGVLAERKGRLAGFALARQAGRGTLIGPVVANDQVLAIALIADLLKASSGFTRIDVPTDAAELSAWLEAAGLARVDQVTTMVRGNLPERHGQARVFGLVSQALS